MVEVGVGLGDNEGNTIFWSVENEGFGDMWRPSEVAGKREEVDKGKRKRSFEFGEDH